MPRPITKSQVDKRRRAQSHPPNAHSTKDRLPRTTGRKLMKALGRRGWAIDRYNGDDAILTHPSISHPIIVRDSNDDVSIGLLHRACKTAQLTARTLRKLLAET